MAFTIEFSRCTAIFDVRSLSNLINGRWISCFSNNDIASIIEEEISYPYDMTAEEKSKSLLSKLEKYYCEIN